MLYSLGTGWLSEINLDDIRVRKFPESLGEKLSRRASDACSGDVDVDMDFDLNEWMDIWIEIYGVRSPKLLFWLLILSDVSE